ncbi:hypothetical protein PMAYCL1PPCAC_24741 [Pristionchus mayeri]|uniref:Uncharacterized protein n=1 Tax=Pristionchus mayeri TaxID=1317129 RepID=A0AAN5D0E2_9BILA|nr:hypothetical protein PMAYCL1PPCAC_24741 [Pristionchus mayeri]
MKEFRVHIDRRDPPLFFHLLTPPLPPLLLPSRLQRLVGLSIISEKYDSSEEMVIYYINLMLQLLLIFTLRCGYRSIISAIEIKRWGEYGNRSGVHYHWGAALR